MAMKPADNELLTRIGPGTPMGVLLRQYWVPALRSAALQADGAPKQFLLFGQSLVAFRATDGRVGVVDEACPHRGVSLALARNEDNGLRCLFHGWKFDVTGSLVDAPCEPQATRDRFCKAVRVPRYGVREAAGLVWVFLGQGEPPAFPDFEFNDLPADHVCIRRAVVPYNWLQGVEAHIDSSHVAFLHGGFLTANKHKLDEVVAANLAAMMEDTSPRLEWEETPYGIQEGALRTQANQQIYARIREIVLPYYTFIPGPEDGPYSARASVPIDDETSAEWYILYNPHRPLTDRDISTLFHGTDDDPDNFAANLGSRDDWWGQDRDAMKQGHFSGLTRNLSFEDFVVQASMGAIFDRSREQLGVSDTIIVKVRRLLLDAVRRHQAGEPPAWRQDFAYPDIRARSVMLDPEQNWRVQAAPSPAVLG